MQQFSATMGIKTRVLIRARALGHHQMPNQLPPVAHCTLVTDSDCYFGVHKAWHLLTHVHNTKWTQLRTAITRQQSWHGASHQKLRYELIRSNASDGPNLSMNMAFSLQLWCRKIAHGTHSNLQYSLASTRELSSGAMCHSSHRGPTMACLGHSYCCDMVFCTRSLLSSLKIVKHTCDNKCKLVSIGKSERCRLADKLLTIATPDAPEQVSWWWEVRRPGCVFRI